MADERKAWKDLAEELRAAYQPIEIPRYEPEINESIGEAAEATMRMSEAMARVVELTEISLKQSERSAEDSKRMSRWSLLVASISGLASIAAVAVAVVALQLGR